MKSDKPKRFSSTVWGIMIVVSAFTVLNFASMNVSAEYHDTDWEITDHQWRENVNITLDDCNLIIKNGGTLTFNNSVILEIVNPQADPNKNGITIEVGGIFEINSPSGNTKIKSSTGNEERTYPFLNSGTIDFL